MPCACSSARTISGRLCQILDQLWTPYGAYHRGLTMVRYRRNQEIACTAYPVEHWCCVVSGAARTCAVLSDGHRRIIDFLMPGDFFGFRQGHCFVTEAIVGGTGASKYPRQYLEKAADCTPCSGPHYLRDSAAINPPL